MSNPQPGFMYFLRVGKAGAIKIGFTRGNPLMRLKALQKTSPHKLRWIAFFPSNTAEDYAIRKRFKEHLIRAEWFSPAEEILNFINEKCPNLDQEKVISEIFQIPLLQEINSMVNFAKKNGRNEFASCLRRSGVDIYDFHKWRSKSRSPSSELLNGVRKAMEMYNFKETHRAGNLSTVR